MTPQSQQDITWAFRQPHYVSLNAVRLDHLETMLRGLGIDPSGERVIDCGAGIGDLAIWWRERGADVLCVDGRAELVDYMTARGFSAVVADLDRADTALHGEWDIGFCYGVLYHLKDWTCLLRALLEQCRVVLVETMIGDGARVKEDRGDWSQSLSGTGSRPRAEDLIRCMAGCGHEVVVPETPDHADYINGQRIILAAVKR